MGGQHKAPRRRQIPVDIIEVRRVLVRRPVTKQDAYVSCVHAPGTSLQLLQSLCLSCLWCVMKQARELRCKECALAKNALNTLLEVTKAADLRLCFAAQGQVRNQGRHPGRFKRRAAGALTASDACLAELVYCFVPALHLHIF